MSYSIMVTIWEVHSLLTLNKISCCNSLLDDMNCPQQNKFLWIVAIGKCLGELNSSLYYGSLRSGTASGCNNMPSGTKRGKKTRREVKEEKWCKKDKQYSDQEECSWGHRRRAL